MNVVRLGVLLADAGGRLVGPFVEHEDQGGYAGVRRVPPSGPVVRRSYVATLGDREALLRGGYYGDQANRTLRELAERPIAYIDVDEAGEVLRWTPVSPIAVVAALLRDRLGAAAVLEG